MFSVSLADGEFEEAEIKTIGDIYAEILGMQPDYSQLKAMALSRQERLCEDPMHRETAALGYLIETLKKELSVLDDNACEMILESAFRVACADGELEPQEERMLQAIASALDVNNRALELEINSFKRRLAAK
jgi:tellurite resistance protein